MKILHTSDWHLGISFYSYDRLAEQSEVLDRIIDIADAEQPDAIIVSGDIFDSTQPSNQAYKLFVDKIEVLRRKCQSTTIVIISGNHDSASRHEVFSTPWKAANVWMIGTIDEENPDKHIIRVSDKGIIVAFPYISSRFIDDDFYSRTIAEAAATTDNTLPIVVAAHLAIPRDNSEQQDSIGNIPCSDANMLGSDFDYAALGHIHHCYQAKSANGRVQYCGTPLGLSFDEEPEHYILAVDIDSRSTSPNIRKIKIEQTKPLITIPEVGYASATECMALITELNTNLQPYVRINICRSDYNAHTINELRTALADKNASFCYACPEPVENTVGESAAISLRDFDALEPEDLAREYIESRGCAFDNELAELFRCACAELDKETQA